MTSGHAEGGVTGEPVEPGSDQVPVEFDAGGWLPPALTTYRNDTGRPLRMDEWRLLTRVDVADPT